MQSCFLSLKSSSDHCTQLHTNADKSLLLSNHFRYLTLHCKVLSKLVNFLFLCSQPPHGCYTLAILNAIWYFLSAHLLTLLKIYPPFKAQHQCPLLFKVLLDFLSFCPIKVNYTFLELQNTLCLLLINSVISYLVSLVYLSKYPNPFIKKMKIFDNWLEK